MEEADAGLDRMKFKAFVGTREKNRVLPSSKGVAKQENYTSLG